MKATKKLLALVLAVCMLIGMPLSINVSAADADTDLVTIEDVYFGTPGTDDESYLYVKFSEKVWLRSSNWKNALGVAIVNQSNAVQERLIVADFTGAYSSDDNGLYKVKMVDTWSTVTASIPEWVRTEFVSSRLHAGSRIVFYVSDRANNDAMVDGKIDLFTTKEDGTGRLLENGTPEITSCTGTGKEGFYYDFSDKYKVTLDNVALKTDLNYDSFTLTFSEAVTLSGAAKYGLCVMKDGVTVSSCRLEQGGWHGAQAGTTYSTTWNLKLYHPSQYGFNTKQIARFIQDEYTDVVAATDAQLCFYIEDTTNSGAGDVINAVYTQGNMKKLKNGSNDISKTTKETYFIPLNVEDIFATPIAYVSTKDKIFVEINGEKDGTWTNQTYLAAFDAAGEILDEWKLTLCSNYKKGDEIANVAFYFGANSSTNYDTIVDYCDTTYSDGYELKLIVKDTATLGNGLVDSLIHKDLDENTTDFIMRADISNETADIGVIPWGEAVTVESVDVYDSGKVIITFSHDIDMNKLMAGIAKDTNGNDFFLGVSAVGVDNLVGYDANADKIVVGGWCDQTGIFDLEPYADSKNKVIGRLDMADYTLMMNNFEELAAKPNTDNLELAIRLRIEMDNAYDTTTGVLPKNYNIDPLTEGVSPLILVHGTSRCGWTDANFIEATDGAVSINGVQTNDLTAITTAPAGSEIILVDDTVIESNGFRVPTDVVLDLNGKTITMSENTGIEVSGTIMDNTDGGALIKVTNKNTTMVKIPGSNPQMPLYDTADGGYRLFHKEFKNQGVKEGTQENSMRYGVHLHFDNMKAYELLAAGGTDVKLTLSLYADGCVDVPLYTFREDTLKEYGEACLNATEEKPLSGKTIVLTVFGMDKLNGASLDVSATLNFMNTVAIGEAVPVVPVA